ncbi:MAG: hypothetical protein H7Y38_14260 [Armatimonadetes bacterium]|nr:hypothetical protein [Armatimonadota bacterium]
MYYVLNPDGSRYGPVTEDVIAQWNREGRIADTAQFVDAVTETQVERERLLPPTAPPQNSLPPVPPQPPTTYGGAGQAQAYQSPTAPRLNDAPPGYTPPGYAPQPTLTGAYGHGQGNPQHNPVYSALWCLLCLAAGYIYNKQIVKGVVITLATFGIGFLTGGIGGWFLLAFAMADCYKIGQRIQAGETVGEWQFF